MKQNTIRRSRRISTGWRHNNWKFKRETAEDLDKNRFYSIYCITNESFVMLNKMCKLKKFVIVADSAQWSGVHVLDSDFNYLKSFNNENKFINVTGLCKTNANTVYISSSKPNSKDTFMFDFEFSNNSVEFKEIYVFKNLCDKERLVVGMEYNKYRNSVFIVRLGALFLFCVETKTLFNFFRFRLFLIKYEKIN